LEQGRHLDLLKLSDAQTKEILERMIAMAGSNSDVAYRVFELTQSGEIKPPMNATNYLVNAAKSGSFRAMCKIYSLGDTGTFNRTYPEFAAAITNRGLGDVFATSRLLFFGEFGSALQLPRDHRTAMRLCEFLREKGYWSDGWGFTSVYEMLGEGYLFGSGVHRDQGKAIELFDSGLQAGDSRCRNIKDMLSLGMLTEVDVKRTARVYCDTRSRELLEYSFVTMPSAWQKEHGKKSCDTDESIEHLRRKAASEGLVLPIELIRLLPFVVARVVAEPSETRYSEGAVKNVDVGDSTAAGKTGRDLWNFTYNADYLVTYTNYSRVFLCGERQQQHNRRGSIRYDDGKWSLHVWTPEDSEDR
jgi:hypothetical protein